MTTQLKDVLHLYGIGTAVRFDRQIWEVTELKRSTIKVIRLDHSHSNEFYYDVCKPILRKLSDMTDEEIDKVASILLGKETHCYEKWRSEDGDCIIAEWKKEKPLPPYDKEYEYMTMGMLIDENFIVKHKWDYHNSKGTGTTNEPLHNHNQITIYFLSRGFDLFGLIESGQAIHQSPSLNPTGGRRKIITK